MLFNSTLCMIACCEVKKEIAIIVIVKPHYTYVVSLMLCSDSSHTTYFFVDEILGQQFRDLLRNLRTQIQLYTLNTLNILLLVTLIRERDHHHKRKYGCQSTVINWL